MSHAKNKLRKKEREAKKTSTVPDIWEVTGIAASGEIMCFTEKTEDAANYAAARINNRGGSVKVTRLVYNGPAAAWIDPKNPYRNRI
jgi:hypothetical protein